MRMSLPTNDALTAFSQDVPWLEIERQRRQFNRQLETLQHAGDTLPLDRLSEAVGALRSACTKLTTLMLRVEMSFFQNMPGARLFLAASSAAVIGRGIRLPKASSLTT